MSVDAISSAEVIISNLLVLARASYGNRSSDANEVFASAEEWLERTAVGRSNAAAAQEAGPVSFLDADGALSKHMPELLVGMSVAVDVSTSEADAGNRYFGTISEVMEDPLERHGVSLLVQSPEPNFTPAHGLKPAAVVSHARTAGAVVSPGGAVQFPSSAALTQFVRKLHEAGANR